MFDPKKAGKKNKNQTFNTPTSLFTPTQHRNRKRRPVEETQKGNKKGKLESGVGEHSVCCHGQNKTRESGNYIRLEKEVIKVGKWEQWNEMCDQTEKDNLGCLLAIALVFLWHNESEVSPTRPQ